MFVALKTIAHVLLLPPAAPLLLALIGYGLLFSRWKRQATWLLGIGLISGWLLSSPLVSDLLWRFAQHYPALDLKQPVKAQAIVVIGGAGYRFRAPEYGGNPAAELGLMDRLTYTAYLARQTHLPVLVSGNGNEALTMRVVLRRDFGVDSRWLENRSRDTFENAAYSAKLLKADGIKRILLVTSSTHQWRATQEFSSTGLEVTPAPVLLYGPRPSEGILEVVPSARAALRSYEAVYELLGDPVRVVLSVLHLRRHTN
jgi:uncharacterized SAM-binding protein YcdF (DUF218 family)